MIADVAWRGLSIDAPGSPPPELDRTGAVALVPAGDRAFAAAAALTVARSLARHGRRVFLCDLDLAHPRLHVMAGVPRGVGVSDYVLYGASHGHVGTELEERLVFISAGTPVVDLEAVFASDRWEALITLATHARASLLLLLPDDLEGAEAVLARAETVVALGTPEECPPLGQLGGKLRLGLRPNGSAPGAPEPEVIDDVWAADPAAVGPDPAAFTEGEAAAPSEDAAEPVARLSAPSTPRSRGREEGGAGRRVVLLLLVALLALAVAVWRGWITLPGLPPIGNDTPSPQLGPVAESTGLPRTAPGAVPDPAPLDRGEETAEATPPAEANRAAPPPADAVDGGAVEAPLQGWTLRLGAFRNHEVARDEAQRLAAAAPGHLFTVVPVDLGDTRWHRVVVVDVVDAAAAEEARAALGETLDSRAGSPAEWIARSTPFAFFLSEHPTLEEARGGIAALAVHGIDAYPLVAPAAGGGLRYRVYAGAYADIGEAGAMSDLLEAAGWDEATLVERRGNRPE